MEVAILMAGLGKRFTEAGFSTPKPLIQVNGKTILDWTLTSVENLINKHPLSFAIRKEHEEKYNIVEGLRNKYGKSTKFILCEGGIKGNLVTGLELTQELVKNKNEPLLFLDSDNKYDIVNFEKLVRSIPEKDFAVLCYFELEDKNDLKWGFCGVDPSSNRVVQIKEKEFVENGKPMVGFFYWSSVEFFEKVASVVIKEESPGKNNEYYMTQAFNYCLKNNYSLYAFKSEIMIPLGTPQDVENFKNNKSYNK